MSYMNLSMTIALHTTAEQISRLQELQNAFAEVCNALAPVVQETRCWNRVALHHLAYRSLRDRYPSMGSQMVCNAIYSVSRMCRIVFQHPGSPWNITKLGGRPLPRLKFTSTAPVYFDRHTLSIKHNRLSMYTLDGRMHFDLNLSDSNEARFHQGKLREVVLSRNGEEFALTFHFSHDEDQLEDMVPSPLTQSGELPEYMIILDSPEMTAASMNMPLPLPPSTPVAELR